MEERKERKEELRRGETDGPNPSLVAWLPFNITGPIITPSPLAAHTHSSTSRELANTLHPHRTHTCTHTDRCTDSGVGSVLRRWHAARGQTAGTVWSLWHSSKISEKIIGLAEGAVKWLSGSTTLIFYCLLMSACLSLPLCAAHLNNSHIAKSVFGGKKSYSYSEGVAGCLREQYSVFLVWGILKLTFDIQIWNIN